MATTDHRLDKDWLNDKAKKGAEQEMQKEKASARKVMRRLALYEARANVIDVDETDVKGNKIEEEGKKVKKNNTAKKEHKRVEKDNLPRMSLTETEACVRVIWPWETGFCKEQYKPCTLKWHVWSSTPCGNPQLCY